MALTLHHAPLSGSSQRVRLALAEKHLAFESHLVDLVAGDQHAPEYVRLNKNHVVPTLVHDGSVLIESVLINEYLDETFANPPLMPCDSAGRHAVRLWIRELDERTQLAVGVISYAIGARAAVLARPAEAREAAIAAMPDPARRDARRSVLEHGVHAPEFPPALRALLTLLDDIEAALALNPWLSGDSFGLADVATLPFVVRLEHLAMDPLVQRPARPRTADWLARAKARPSFAEAILGWAPPPVLAAFRAAGEAVWPVVSGLAAAR